MNWIKNKILNVANKRLPDQIIGPIEDPYLRRWYLIPHNRYFNMYLHHFMKSDDDRALHDHPWWNLSCLLKGKYIEHTISDGGINVKTERKAGAYKFRIASSAHRVELSDGPCWTLFITGPHCREWGFHCPKGWVHWKQFTRTDGLKGQGCGEYD